VRVVAACLVGAVLLAGCATAPAADLEPLPAGAPPTAAAAAKKASGGAGNSVGDLPGAAIMSRAKAALLAARSVRLIGYVAGGGGLLAIDIRIKGRQGGVGFVKINGHQVDMIRIGSVLYIRADEAFWRSAGASARDAALLTRKYVRLRVGHGQTAADLASFTDIASLAGVLFPASSMIIKGAHRTIRGVEAVGVTAVNDSRNTTYVALTGQPLPMRVVPRGKTADLSLNFVDYGKPVTLAAPPAGQVIDGGALPGG
jgi:hypothetical protein